MKRPANTQTIISFLRVVKQYETETVKFYQIFVRIKSVSDHLFSCSDDSVMDIQGNTTEKGNRKHAVNSSEITMKNDQCSFPDDSSRNNVSSNEEQPDHHRNPNQTTSALDMEKQQNVNLTHK